MTRQGQSRSLTAPVSGGADRLIDALRRLDEPGIRLQDVGLRRPTLDQVFLALTGHRVDEQGAEEKETVG